MQGNMLIELQDSYKLYSSGIRCLQILTLDNPAARMISSV